MRGKKASAAAAPDNWYNEDAGNSEEDPGDYSIAEGKRAGGQSKGFVGKINYCVLVQPMGMRDMTVVFVCSKLNFFLRLDFAHKP